jgi:hypothetical protein
MTSKKKTTNLTALRIGSRVRCTDDGVEGRIVWANGVSVKITSDDGEQVTWRRDTLADKPIEFLDAEDEQAEAPAPEQPAAEQAEPERPLTVEQATAPEPPDAERAPQAQEQTAAATEVPAAAAAVPAAEPQAPPADSGTEPAPALEKPKRQRKAPAEPREKKVSALDAAARVLAEENRPMTCQEMIEAMAAKGYWSSPKGATPAATLYSAVLRELTTKGSAARFVKAERGKFARNAGA